MEDARGGSRRQLVTKVELIDVVYSSYLRHDVAHHHAVGDRDTPRKLPLLLGTVSWITLSQ